MKMLAQFFKIRVEVNGLPAFQHADKGFQVWRGLEPENFRDPAALHLGSCDAKNLFVGGVHIQHQVVHRCAGFVAQQLKHAESFSHGAEQGGEVHVALGQHAAYAQQALAHDADQQAGQEQTAPLDEVVRMFYGEAALGGNGRVVHSHGAQPRGHQAGPQAAAERAQDDGHHEKDEHGLRAQVWGKNRAHGFRGQGRGHGQSVYGPTRNSVAEKPRHAPPILGVA